MWQVTQDLCNWPLELTVVTCRGENGLRGVPQITWVPWAAGGCFVQGMMECLLVWTDLGYPEGCKRLGNSQEQHPLPPSPLCSGVCSGNVGRILEGILEDSNIRRF